MRLADFIRSNREPILAEWEAFARTCTPASDPMDIAALRDHANAMLSVIATDLSTPQGAFAQAEKAQGRAPAEVAATRAVAEEAQGRAPAEIDGLRTAAEVHGTGRAQSGFTMAQMAAEYRALRASVVRLWTKAEGTLNATDIEDLTRFHEAVDQALAESILRFNQDLEQSKETFLAILGHDLRTPLGAIWTSAAFLLETPNLEEEVERTLLMRIAGSAKRSVTMVGDLLDFTRSRLGTGIPVVRKDMDLVELLHTVVDEVVAAHPTHAIRVDAPGAAPGHWDPARLSQVLGNLIGNAVQHGEAASAVTVTLRDEAEQVTVAVHNRGDAIPSAQLDGLFNPMRARLTPVTSHRAVTSANPAAGGPTGSLGLGLYIAERIVAAHDGSLDVTSTEASGTTFTAYLPRVASPPVT